MSPARLVSKAHVSSVLSLPKILGFPPLLFSLRDEMKLIHLGDYSLEICIGLVKVRYVSFLFLKRIWFLFLAGALESVRD